jgi:hypothetical protein
MDDTAVRALLSLHRTLLEFERRAYEKVHGRATGAEFLQALLGDPAFVWLAPLTSLVARLDEVANAEEARALLAGPGEFAARCAARVQLSPEVAFAHAAARHALARNLPTARRPAGEDDLDGRVHDLVRRVS